MSLFAPGSPPPRPEPLRAACVRRYLFEPIGEQPHFEPGEGGGRAQGEAEGAPGKDRPPRGERPA